MHSLSVMLKPASGQCNMHCDYCFYCDEMEQRAQASYGFMSEETLQNVIRKTMLNADREISFSYQGGEPTLAGLAFFEKAVELQRKYNRKGIRVHNALQTNGYALNEKWCQFFVRHQFLIGLSIDGVQETHDVYRHGRMLQDKEQRTEQSRSRIPIESETCETDIVQGRKNQTYERALHAADLLARCGVDFNILTVVNRQTAARIEEYRTRTTAVAAGTISSILPVCRRWDRLCPIPRMCFHRKQYGDFLIRLFHLWYRDWKKNRQPYIRQFENWIGMLAGYPPEACDQHGTCGIQSRFRAASSACSASRIRSAMRLKASSRHCTPAARRSSCSRVTMSARLRPSRHASASTPGALRCFRPTRPTKSCVSRTREVLFSQRQKVVLTLAIRNVYAMYIVQLRIAKVKTTFCLCENSAPPASLRRRTSSALSDGST